MQIKVIFTLVAVVCLTATPAFAAGIATPDPSSQGEFIVGKGTKAEEVYEKEGRAGTDTYEYGKGLHLGSLLVKPHVEYDRVWENNLFYEENARDKDWISRLLAGLGFDFPLAGGQHLITGDWTSEFEWFDRFEDQNHNDNTAKIGGVFNFVPFSLVVEDTYRDTVSRADTEFTSRISRIENAAHVFVEVPFASFFLETEAFDYNLDFKLPEQSRFDRHDFSIYQRIGMDIAPSTQLLGEYGYTIVHYTSSDAEGRDADANQGSAGLRGQLTERMTYQAWLGYQSRVYLADERPDYYGLIARGALQYDLSEASKIIVRADRRPEESTFDGQSFYVRNRVEAGWTQQLIDRLLLSVSGYVQYNEYSRNSTVGGDSETRRDYQSSGAAGLEYFFWHEVASVFGEYRFTARDSNTAGLDYDAQTATMGVKAHF